MDSHESIRTGVGDQLHVKQEKFDISNYDSSSDKVLQFKLALHRHREKSAIITINSAVEEVAVEKVPKQVQCVDLTISDGEEERSPPISDHIFNNERRLSDGDSGLDSESAQAVGTEHEPVANISTAATTVHENYEQTQNGTDGGGDHEGLIDEADVSRNNGSVQYEIPVKIRTPKGGRSRAKTTPRAPSSPIEKYTPEEKQIAVIGNPAFDYRTRINRITGQELYAIYKCTLCPTGFPRMFHLQVHQRCHAKTRRGEYACTECNFTTTNCSFLAHHKQRHELQNGCSQTALTYVNEGEAGSSPRKRPPSNESPVGTQKRSRPQDDIEKLINEMATNENNDNQNGRIDSEDVIAAVDLSSNFALRGVGRGSLSAEEREERLEARKGNPNFVYPNVTRFHKNGKEYARTSYLCQQCPYSCGKFDLLIRHNRGHNERRQYTCTMCTYSTNTQHHMERHETYHSLQSPTSKGIPGALINPKLRKHMPSHNKPKIPGTTATVENMSENRIKCNYCPAILSGMKNKHIHERQHGKPGMRFICSICDYSSNREDYINRHLQCHTEDDTAPLSAHMLPVPMESETQEIEHEDEDDDSTMETSPNDTGHEDVSEEEYQRLIEGNPKFTYMTVNKNGNPVPAENSFKCWHCPFATTKFTAYNSHKQCHGAKSKYRCVICNYSAKTYRGMKNHQLAHKVHLQHPPPTTKRTNHVTGIPQTNVDGLTSLDAPRFVLPVAPAPRIDNSTTEATPLGAQFFISNIKIQNIMPMNTEEPTGADVSESGILKLKGETEQGKSSFILAVMMGLGYDLFLENIDSLTSICGLNLRNIISYGKKFATVDLTLSLHAFPLLQKEFGTHLNFQRRITREPTQLSNMIIVSSADPLVKTSVRPKILGKSELKTFLEKMKLSPRRLRLMLLDGENVKYMLDHPEIWYEFFEAALTEGNDEAEKKIEEVDYLLKRLQNSEKWKQLKVQCLKNQVEDVPPLESEEILKTKETDWMDYSNCAEEVVALTKEREELQDKRKGFVLQMEGDPEHLLSRMHTAYNNFLNKVKCCGEISVSHQKKVVAICVQKLESKELPPKNLDEIQGIWNGMSYGKKRLAIIGLYIALWEVSSYLQIFAADAFSCTETDFKVPPLGLPTLWDLMNKKCLEKKQCIISLPPNY